MLLKPERTSAGWRLHLPGDVERVETMRRLLGAGLPTTTIRRILPCPQVSPAEQTGSLRKELAAEPARLRAQRDDLDRQVRAVGLLLATPSAHRHRPDADA